MNMMRMALQAVTTAKVIFTTFTTLASPSTPTGVDSPTIPTLRAATPAELRWKGNPIAAEACLADQNTPTLTPALSLRPRTAHRSMATPIEVSNLSELRWRRFSRPQGR